jgi:hypothetical protein
MSCNTRVLDVEKPNERIAALAWESDKREIVEILFVIGEGRSREKAARRWDQEIIRRTHMLEFVLVYM